MYCFVSNIGKPPFLPCTVANAPIHYKGLVRCWNWSKDNEGIIKPKTLRQKCRKLEIKMGNMP